MFDVKLLTYYLSKIIKKENEKEIMISTRVFNVFSVWMERFVTRVKVILLKTEQSFVSMKCAS